jgi:hypothetical protein
MKTFRQFKEQMVAPGNPVKGDLLNLDDLETKKQKLRDKVKIYKKYNLFPKA